MRLERVLSEALREPYEDLEADVLKTPFKTIKLPGTVRKPT